MIDPDKLKSIKSYREGVKHALMQFIGLPEVNSVLKTIDDIEAKEKELQKEKLLSRREEAGTAWHC